VVLVGRAKEEDRHQLAALDLGEREDRLDGRVALLHLFPERLAAGGIGQDEVVLGAHDLLELVARVGGREALPLGLGFLVAPPPVARLAGAAHAAREEVLDRLGAFEVG
jgi:hypothetical protein